MVDSLSSWFLVSHVNHQQRYRNSSYSSFGSSFEPAPSEKKEALAGSYKRLLTYYFTTLLFMRFDI
jgi:NADH:ubiquinone oxidoreductase subunit 3 (subunit A)